MNVICSSIYFTCLAIAFTSVMSQNLVPFPNLLPLPQQFQQFPQPSGVCESFDPLCPSSVLKLAKFGARFKEIVKSTEQLQKIFEKSISADESSQLFYQTCYEALVKAGVTAPESVAEEVAQSIRATWDFLTQDQLLDTNADGVGVYLLDENVLTDLNAFQLANDLANAILKNMPAVLDSLGLSRALSNGFLDFLIPLGIYSPEKAPAFSIGFTKEVYAATGVKYEDDVSAPGTKPVASTVYGIKSFSDNFVDFVGASTLLTNIFDLHQSSSAVSTWHDVFYQEAQNLNFNDPEYIANSFSSVLDQTYDALTPSIFARSFARGYALHLLAHGYLNSDAAIELSQEFANLIEGLANNLPPNAILQIKYQVLTIAFQKFAESHPNLPYGNSQLKAITRYVKNDILASTGTKRQH